MQKKLSELLDISIGRTPSRNEPAYWGKGHKWVSIRDLNSKTITKTKEQITDVAVKEARCKIVRKGTLLFSFKLTIGKIAFAGSDLFTNEAIAAFSIKDKKQLDSEFLYYALLATTFGGSNQAVMGKTLNLKSLAEIEIPLPPLDDQIRIAHLLGKVEGLIAQRKQHLQQLDDLLKSVFLDMFGDPVRNEKGWKSTTIGELASEVKYGTSASAQGGQYKYLRMNNITQDGYWDFKNLKYIDIGENDLAKYELRKGDLVFNRTNSKELVGKTAVYDGDESVVIAGYLIRVRFNNDTNPWFVWGHLNSKFGKTRLFNLCRNIVGMANINAKELQAIPILKPPIELQNQFAAIVEKVEHLKTRYQQSLSDLQALYGTLSQQAFKGELDLSRIPLKTN